MTETKNYKLKKPAQEDFYNIDDLNDNMDIIDETLKNKAGLDEDGRLSEDQMPESWSDKQSAITGEAGQYVGFDADGKPIPTGILRPRTARFVVGTSTSGWTANDCDYLCDGEADDVEINAAIQALPDTGGEVVILDGTYLLTDRLYVNKQGTCLRGNGAGTVLKRNFVVGTGGYTVDAVIKVTATYCKLQNYVVDGNRALFTDAGLTNIYIKENYCSIDKVISHEAAYGIMGRPFAEYFKITNCLCYNHDSTGITAGSNGVVIGNICTRNATGIAVANSLGTTSNGPYNTLVSGNICVSNTNCGINSTYSHQCTVTGNICRENAGYGIIFLACDHSIVANNNCSNNSTGGIRFSYVEYGVIESNIARENGEYSIFLAGTGNTYNLIASNNIYGMNYVNESDGTNTFVNNKFE